MAPEPLVEVFGFCSINRQLDFIVNLIVREAKKGGIRSFCDRTPPFQFTIFSHSVQLKPQNRCGNQIAPHYGYPSC